MENIIEFKKFSKIYQLVNEKIKELDNVDFVVQKGEFISILGPSGSGKTTLMNIIGLLDTPDSGKYFLQGVDVNKLNDNRLAEIRNKEIGFVFQNFNLLNKFTALENVMVPLMYMSINNKESKERAKTYLQKMGLSNRGNHYPNQLSGGQMQRVAIARALVCKPTIVLADEPTGALDSKTSCEIMDLLQELNQEGQTIIIITHDINVAKRAKRIIHILDGKLYEEVADENIKHHKNCNKKLS